MARCELQPDAATIIALRGYVDIYGYGGRFYARRWPRKKSPVRTPGEQWSSARFAAATRWTSFVGLDAYMVRQFTAYLQSCEVTWVDCQRATALGKPWFLIPSTFPDLVP